jgi:CheY-like chemotaxis protein
MKPRLRPILLVDGHQTIRGVMAQLLRDAGFSTLEARDSNEGLRLARTHAPSVIRLDMSLPDESSPVILRELKENPSTWEIPVIAVNNSATNIAVQAETERVNGNLRHPST